MKSKKLLPLFSGAIVGGLASIGSAAADCQDLTVKDDEIILYIDANCEGNIKIFGVGSHPHIGDWSDETSSIKVGKNVKATIYKDSNLSSPNESATLWNGDYPHLQWFGDEMSSVKVEAVEPGTQVITMFENDKDANQDRRQTFHRVAVGEYNAGDNPHQLLLADMMTMMFIPQGMKVTVWDEHKKQGASETYEAIDGARTINFADEGWNDMISSIKVDRVGYELYKVSTWKDKETLEADEKSTIGVGNTCSHDANASDAKTCSITVGYSEDTTTSFSWNEETSISAGLTVSENASVGVEGVGSVGEEVSVSTELTQSFGVGGEDSKTQQKSMSFTDEITVEPGEVIRGEVTAVKKKVKLYPLYHYRPVGSSSSKDEYTRKGTITVDSYADVEGTTTVIRSAALSNSAMIPSVMPGTILNIDEKHYTANKAYYLVLQKDGNLVVYDANDSFVWGSHNDANTPLNGKHAELKVSGNFVLEDGADNILWQTGIENPQARLAIENRQLKVVDKTNQTLWPKN
ncbi:bulb-type lectin domain-containing protein [Parvularcula sp. LCG005]|uniref:bulb-type lectin domain-containing protein n=1 Tax=Parvularcula sp. LCG005 TaxID=3078805 RepID=UPI002942C0F2|nr:bulb-type lectin domain-containing protein [Parvularcula sp. LCG005]WOI54064.1 bulb-type lectin domain-containing protein [Parvularcula sp. LCG005]